MNEKPDNDRYPTDELPVQEMPEAVVEKSRALSIIWLIPLVAAIIGIWLAYKTLSERGPVITLIFKEATDLEAGKTKIKYKALEVGQVEKITLSEDLSHAIVTARMAKEMESYLGENTRFWLVRPQLGLQGVTGLETLVSGTYIGVAFGGKKPTRSFTALERAPLITPDTPGRQYVLEADRLGSLHTGAPVYFRDIPVGEVLNTELALDQRSVLVHIFVYAPHDQLVHDDSRFWRVSGLDLSLGAQGINVKMESLLSFIIGGISFDTPNLSEAVQPSAASARFGLYDSFTSISEASYTVRQPYLMYFSGSVRGLSVGAPVELKGLKVGSVSDVRLEIEPKTMAVRIPVSVEIDPQRILTTAELNQIMQATGYKATSPEQQRPAMEKLIERGLRAQLKTGSLLTGQLYVDLDFYPASPPATLTYGGQYPEIPTVPTALEEFQDSAAAILANLKKLPLDKIGNELALTLQSANRLISDPNLKDTLRSLDVVLKDVQKLAQTADRQVAALATNAAKTLESVRAVLENVEPGAPVAVDLANTLEELAAAARSMRVLSNYLERHPEALLYGKGGSGDKP